MKFTVFFYLFLGFTLMGLIGYGQDRITFKGGVSLANQKEELLIDLPNGEAASGMNRKMIFRPYAGVSAILKLSDNFSLEPEVSYIGMGSDLYQKTLLDYVAVPVSIRYDANQLLSLFSGFYGAWIFHSNNKAYAKTIKKYDAGIQLGTEVKIYRKLGAGARYFFGLTNLDDETVRRVSDGEYKVYNRSFQMYVFYNWPFGNTKN